MKKDSVIVTSSCSFRLKLKYFPDTFIDTLRSSNSYGAAVIETGIVEYRGNVKSKKGVYRVYCWGEILEECEFYNYMPHGTYKRYATGFKIPPKVCIQKIKFKNGLKQGKWIEYKQKTGKKYIIEYYDKGNLLKEIHKYDKWW